MTPFANVREAAERKVGAAAASARETVAPLLVDRTATDRAFERIYGRHVRDVYRYALASWYGPGLYGNGTACGKTLTPGMLGVANRSLPCGTRVKLRYHRRSVPVPVIDRGPYIPARMWDISGAAAEALRFPGLGPVQWRIG